MSCKTSKNLKIELYLIEIDNAVSSEWRKNRGGPKFTYPEKSPRLAMYIKFYDIQIN